MVEIVNRLPFNAEARVRSQASPYGTFGEGWHWDRFFFEHSSFYSSIAIHHFSSSLLIHLCFVVTFKSSTILAVDSTIKFNTSVCLYKQNCDRNHLAGFEWFCFGVVSRRIHVILYPERHSFITVHVPSLKSLPSRDGTISRQQRRLFFTLMLLAVFYTISL